ncbi:MAG: AMP-dependent synthetase/ligase [Gemmatimonadota bacterium]
MATEAATHTHASRPGFEGLTGGTMARLFLDSVRRNPGVAACRRRADGTWETFDRGEVAARVRALAAGLRSLGCGHGDPIAILSHTRLEWAIADWAILLGGRVTVTVYPSLPPDQVLHILRDSRARLVFASDSAQVEKLVEIAGELPDLKTVVVFDAPGAAQPGSDDPSIGTDAFRLLALCDLESTGQASEYHARVDEDAARIAPEDLASLLYTSGTTGPPKGVMLTHANLYANSMQCASVLPLTSEDTALSWLPLSHAFERTAGHFMLWSTGAKIAYADSTDTVARDMGEVAPTLMFGVPRMYEKFYEAVEAAVMKGGPLKRAIFAFARRVGSEWAERQVAGRPVGPLVGLGHRIADRLVFAKMRARTGGRIRYFVSGAAPLSPEINRFFYAAGMKVLEGYGLSETSPVINVNLPDDIRFGTVGPPLPGTEQRIADDGEVMVRGPQVMAGYFGNEAATAQVLGADGWLATGDIGTLDADGFLTITDRKKDLIVTAAGKNISPTALEERMARSPLIENVVLLGDKRKFTMALAVPGLAALEAAFPGRKLSLDDREALALDPAVRDVLEADLLPRVADFARHERPKIVIPVPEPFTIDNGLLTPSMKVKRRAVRDRFAELIEERYEAAEQAHDREAPGE